MNDSTTNSPVIKFRRLRACNVLVDPAMFKWTCLVVIVLFLAATSFLFNELRLDIGRSAKVVQDAGETINQNLPEIVEKTRATTDTLAELADDVRQLKELAGVSASARDKNLVAYAASVLDFIEASGGTIGLKKTFGTGLKNPVSAAEWVTGARKESLLLTVLANSKKDYVVRLTRNTFRSPWYVQLDGKEPVTLLDWLKSAHAPTKEAMQTGAGKSPDSAAAEAARDHRGRSQLRPTTSTDRVPSRMPRNPSP